MYEPTIEYDPPEDEEQFGKTISAPPVYYSKYEAAYEEYAPQHYEYLYDTRLGIRDAARRHDAMARRKYVKPFKWFKFNRARKATAK